MTDLARHLGERARAARQALGLTQAQIAEDVGIAVEVYGRLERGGLLPSVPTLIKLSRALSVTPNALLLVGHRVKTQPSKAPELRRLVRMLERADRHQLRRVLLVVTAMIGDRARSSPPAASSRAAETSPRYRPARPPRRGS